MYLATFLSSAQQDKILNNFLFFWNGILILSIKIFHFCFIGLSVYRSTGTTFTIGLPVYQYYRSTGPTFTMGLPVYWSTGPTFTNCPFWLFKTWSSINIHFLFVPWCFIFPIQPQLLWYFRRYYWIQLSHSLIFMEKLFLKIGNKAFLRQLSTNEFSTRLYFCVYQFYQRF